MKKGFTLIELMIVVAIIAFLATLSIPKYFKYYDKAKKAEVAMNLASLHTAMLVYYAENGTYANILNGKDKLDWSPAGYNNGQEDAKFYYTYGFNFSGAQEGVHYFTGKLKTPKDKLGNTYIKNDKFLAGAAGQLNEKTCDIWQIDENRNLKNINS